MKGIPTGKHEGDEGHETDRDSIVLTRIPSCFSSASCLPVGIYSI
jgi:hypothetical protein